jgi:hypothetical protein
LIDIVVSDWRRIVVDRWKPPSADEDVAAAPAAEAAPEPAAGNGAGPARTEELADALDVRPTGSSGRSMVFGAPASTPTEGSASSVGSDEPTLLPLRDASRVVADV